MVPGERFLCARLECLALGGSGVILWGMRGRSAGKWRFEAKAGAGGVGNDRWVGGSWGVVLDEDVDAFGLCREMGSLLVALC